MEGVGDTLSCGSNLSGGYDLVRVSVEALRHSLPSDIGEKKGDATASVVLVSPGVPLRGINKTLAQSLSAAKSMRS
jgi:hypothetical protein